LPWTLYLFFTYFFIGGDFGEGCGELERAGLGENFTAQAAGQGQQAGGGQIGHTPRFEFGFHLAESVAQGPDADLARGEHGMLERFHFDGLEVLDFKPELAAPVDEGLPRDFEFGGDAVVALACERRSTKRFCVSMSCIRADDSTRARETNGRVFDPAAEWTVTR
jgi:hypothetical protein